MDKNKKGLRDIQALQETVSYLLKLHNRPYTYMLWIMSFAMVTYGILIGYGDKDRESWIMFLLHCLAGVWAYILLLSPMVCKLPKYGSEAYHKMQEGKANRKTYKIEQDVAKYVNVIDMKPYLVASELENYKKRLKMYAKQMKWSTQREEEVIEEVKKIMYDHRAGVMLDLTRMRVFITLFPLFYALLIKGVYANLLPYDLTINFLSVLLLPIAYYTAKRYGANQRKCEEYIVKGYRENLEKIVEEEKRLGYD